MCSFLYLTLKNSIKDFRFDIHHFPLVKKELIPADTRVKAGIIPDSMCITGLKRKTTKQPHIHTCYQFGSKRHVWTVEEIHAITGTIYRKEVQTIPKPHFTVFD